jgi:hypothetical protein
MVGSPVRSVDNWCYKTSQSLDRDDDKVKGEHREAGVLNRSVSFEIALDVNASSRATGVFWRTSVPDLIRGADARY